MSDFLKKLKALSKANVVINKIGAEAVNFSKERFRAQNWVDINTEQWPKRKPTKESKQRASRGVLTSTGRLRRSIRKISANADSIVIGTDVPYAQIHNDGGRFRSKQNVRAFTRGEHTRKGVKVRQHKVNGFTRVISVNMPRRRFLGNSAILARRIERVAYVEFNKILK